ncbi:MAG TPA: DUF4149 domain-containing protein [Bacteriovoracaceae bacterium]|nr:DUF4149 domain-containing protein [Bacteriovoracaceae bacterium]
MSRKVLPPFIIALASIWLGWTVLVDFFIVPVVFQKIGDFFMAGFLGIEVFSKLNNLEVLVASALVALTALSVKRGKSAIVAFVLSLILWFVAMFYFSYLTPKIISLTEQWKRADLMGLTGLSGIPDLQQEHQYYHRMYIAIDSVKLGLLSILIGFGIWRGDEWK